MVDLQQELNRRTREGELYQKLPKYKDRIECFACAHRCKIKQGKSGICNVRYNQNGKLQVPHNYIAGFQCDPIEKKPFFHSYPNTYAMSFGMLGCDLHCGYCQNWITSQSLRDENAGVNPRDITPEEFVEYALRQNARAVVSTYNEPLITAEWSMEIFKEARKHNLATGFVSNGNATPEVLDYIRPHTDLYKVDLKSFQDKNYRKLGGSLEKILQGIEMIYNRGFWLELVTLLVPGFNDSKEELDEMTQFIEGIDPNIPWHVTAYHPDYNMQENRRTTPDDLLRAANIGADNGLNYIYAGNLPGRVEDWESTKCHNCGTKVVTRKGFWMIDYQLTVDGQCPECLTTIPGRWEEPPKERNEFIRLFR